MGKLYHRVLPNKFFKFLEFPKLTDPSMEYNEKLLSGAAFYKNIESGSASNTPYFVSKNTDGCVR